MTQYLVMLELLLMQPMSRTLWLFDSILVSMNAMEDILLYLDQIY